MEPRAFLPDPLLAALDQAAAPVPGVPGLRVPQALQDAFPEQEGPLVLGLVARLTRDSATARGAIRARRAQVRAWIDRTTLALQHANAGRSPADPDYRTVVGQADAQGEVWVGPAPEACHNPPVRLPPHHDCFHITLFGPPDSARMCINAMNAVHRSRPDEPPLVASLVAESGLLPRWGADSEDSKTPLSHELRTASRNLVDCFAGTIAYTHPRTGKAYRLADEGRSWPIKRIPGLALPDGDHLLDGTPVPLHLVELVQHLWLHRHRPEARVLYVPKLEDEHEARYLAGLIAHAEALVQGADPTWVPGPCRVILVFENPRAIFRIREMAAALHPYFMGGSLGWHDFLASTARLFRHDPGYRIPVKADPDIVIRHIRESHHILVRDLGPCGALKIGGMYGVLFQDGDPDSFMQSMVGYIRDVSTQLKRGLDGFWVAHPDFVRIGIALVAAWRRHVADPTDPSLVALIQALVPDPVEQAPLLAFVLGPDQPGLPQDDPRYLRAVLAAELDSSPKVANHDPEEVRYNVFQALQYLADWLCGNGCVALPATLRGQDGQPVAVRIMDDLATTERSRWEVWAEVHHGRVGLDQFEEILGAVCAVLQAGKTADGQPVAVPWTGAAAHWYPTAVRLLRQLMTDPDPPEFVTELMLPFIFGPIREAEDPYAAAQRLCPGKYR